MGPASDKISPTNHLHDLGKRYVLFVVLRKLGVEVSIQSGYDTQTELRAKFKVAKDFVGQGVLRSAEAADLKLHKVLSKV